MVLKHYDKKSASSSENYSLENTPSDGAFFSTLVSRNITVQGRRTSVRLEPEMWSALREISNREKCSMHDICTLVSVCKNESTSLTAAIRVFLMLYFRAGCTEEGHSRAGHGSFEFMKMRAKVNRDMERYFSKGTRASNRVSNRR